MRLTVSCLPPSSGPHGLNTVPIVTKTRYSDSPCNSLLNGTFGRMGFKGGCRVGAGTSPKRNCCPAVQQPPFSTRPGIYSKSPRKSLSNGTTPEPIGRVLTSGQWAPPPQRLPWPARTTALSPAARHTIGILSTGALQWYPWPP